MPTQFVGNGKCIKQQYLDVLSGVSQKEKRKNKSNISNILRRH